jgi:ankyrin repeat protein
MKVSFSLGRFFHSPIPRLIFITTVGLTWSNLAFCGEIHEAAEKGNLARVEALLKENPNLVNVKDNEGYTPLYLASFARKKDVVELLLAHKADPNVKGKDGLTPLHEAAKVGHKEVAEVLLAGGAEINAKDNNVGWTPLHFAVATGSKEVAKLLLLNKADINAKGEYGDTPLHVAVLNGKKELVELLLANNAEVNNRDNEGNTPLRLAERGFKEIANLLRQHGGRE